MNKLIFFIKLLALSSLTFAQSTFVELPDGNKIIIKEDKTWDFVEKAELTKELPPKINANDIWKNENISINTTDWIKVKNTDSFVLVSYMDEKRSNYFVVYEENIDIALSKFISLTLKQKQNLKGLTKVKIEKQLSFKQNNRNHAQLVISAEYDGIPASYVYNIYSFKGGYTSVVGYTIGKNFKVIEDFKNRIILNN